MPGRGGIGLAVRGFQQCCGLIASLTLVNIGISCAKPPLWTMPTMFLSGAAAATGIATINSIGNLGGFAGPVMIGWIKDKTGSYAGGLYFVAGLLVMSAVHCCWPARRGERLRRQRWQRADLLTRLQRT